MKLRNRLNRILFERGLAEGELASVCRLDQGHLNRIKNGRVKPTLVTALRIANALGLPVNQLFYLDVASADDLSASQESSTARPDGELRRASAHRASLAEARLPVEQRQAR